MLISRGIKIGNIISFSYDDPRGACKNGTERTGTIHRMYRAKPTKKNPGYLMFVIVDHKVPTTSYDEKPPFRQFRYRNMRNIKIKTS